MAAGTKAFRVLKFRLRITGLNKPGSRGNRRLSRTEDHMVLRVFRLCKPKTLPYLEVQKWVLAGRDIHTGMVGKRSATKIGRSCSPLKR
jgi:hypothetical protein